MENMTMTDKNEETQESKTDIIFVKIGKFVDWIEIDIDDPDEVDFMQTVVEPFLDLSIRKDDKGVANQKFHFSDKSGSQYNTTIRALVTGGMKVYYHDADIKPNLTPFLSERKAGLVNNLLDEISEYMYDMEVAKQQNTQQQPE